MAVQAWLTASQRRIDGGTSGRITSDRQLLGDRITIGRREPEHSEHQCKVIADVVDVLLSVYELVERGDAIVSEEFVVCRRVQAWARTADIVWPWTKRRWLAIAVPRRDRILMLTWSDEGVSGITSGRNLKPALAVAWQTVLGIVVRILARDWGSSDVVGVERAGCGPASTFTSLLPLVGTSSLEKGRVDPWLFSNPRKCVCPGHKESEYCLLHRVLRGGEIEEEE